MSSFEETLDAVLADVRDMLLSKREIYGENNLTEFGNFGILVRTSDKVSRLKSIHSKRTYLSDHQENEYDAWFDIAGYAVLALIEEELGVQE
jgi:hypothetical protein